MIVRDTIAHDGMIQKVENGIASVTFIRSSGCAGCSIQSSCGMAESDDAIIEVPLQGRDLKEGDSVVIRASATKGYAATALAYFVPFLIVITTITVTTAVGVPEAPAGLISLATLVPYYVCLKIFNRVYRNELSIDILKR